ncbi:MAG: M28 family peptidase [Thermaerobacterales bacterium]
MEDQAGGTEGEKGARDFLAERMQAAGLTGVTVEPFEYLGWYRGNCTLTVTGPSEQRVIPSVSLAYTGTHQLEGELLVIGYGTPGEFESLRDQVPGKMVLVAAKSSAYHQRSIHRCEKIGRAVELGAADVLWMRWDGGLMEEAGAAMWNREVELPCLSLSREAGETLKRMAAGGPVRLRLDVANTLEPATSWNIYGDIAGTRLKEQQIIIGAHFEGHDVAVGALDDGAGAVIVLEIARALACHAGSFARTLRFITFPLEESGFIGAHAYVDSHPDELDQIVFMLNLDGAGRSGAPHGIMLQGHRSELIQPLRRIGREINEPLLADNGMSLYSDHFPFYEAGVPAGLVQVMDVPKAGVRGFSHTAADTLDKVNPSHLQQTALQAARWIARLADLDPWPARRQTPAEAAAAVEAFGYTEALKLEKRYRF